jgi:hypothetical protein
MSRSIRIITTTTLVSLLSSGVALADDNLARGAKVRQSSTGFGGHAQRAVDGNTEGRYERNSVTHTQNGALAWLEVDLGQARKVGTVVVYNRTDCCAERLVGARVELGDEPCDRDALRVTRGLPLVGAGVAPRTELDFAATAARYLCVRLDTRDYLSVAEVEVFAPRAASATPAAMVGEYAARHPHWAGSVSLRADGSYARDNGDPGVWSFDGRVLTLHWKNWGPERLVDRGGGRYVAEGNGFELVRRGGPVSPPTTPAPTVAPVVMPVVTPVVTLAEPASRDCGTGADDAGCAQALGGALPMPAVDFKTLMGTLEGERSEINRKALLDTLVKDSKLTARQLVAIMGAFRSEIYQLDIARENVERVVDPKAAVRSASMFRSSISKREFIELMSR